MFALLLQELRKIWRPGVVVALIVAAIAYAVPYTQLEYGNLNAPGDITNGDTVSLIDEYGPVVDRESVDAMKDDLPELKSRLNKKIAADNRSKTYGITDYDSFVTVADKRGYAFGFDDDGNTITSATDSADAQADDAWDRYCSKFTAMSEYRAVEARRQIIDDYEWNMTKGNIALRVVNGLGLAERVGLPDDGSLADLASVSLPKTAAAQVERLYAQRDNTGYLEKYTDAYETTMLMMFLMFVYSVVMSVVLTASLFITDRKRNMRQLQWSSRTGRRRMTGVQLLAIGLSSLAVCVVMAAVFAGVWLPQVWPYLATPVFSTSVLPWFVGWNFAGYLTAVALLGMVMSVTFTLGVAWVTHWFDGLIRALLVVVPLTALFLFCAIYAVLGEAFLMTNALSMHTGLPGCEIAVAAAMAAVVAAVWAVTLRRARRADLAR
ncbi:hypothetical protein CS006_04320 [Bifidobacterium primatium]|uniref:ABC-2 type transporter transmembrane domain-containing protein n=1 Tax=Bifidobacterium primatium TaxID=2045438 RepID=A0A2M9H901_9BIFI|nr:ABC transporter permease [Bifidobacterium primatium]PJM73279.1 hypothetical protein CS006_04320 [Bifidobacterium primatium]